MRSAELMLNEAFRMYEAGQNPGEEANLAKLQSADASGRQRKPVFRPLAVSALPQNIILSANIAKLGCIRLRPSQLILSLAILQNMC